MHTLTISDLLFNHSEPINCGTVGALTPYQASCLYDILDFRWQRRMPTWCSVNVSSSEEADQRLGAVITDRLQDGAMVLRLTWPSYRKPRSII